MKNHVIFKKSLNSKLHWFHIGKGAKLNLLEAGLPLLCFVWHSYLEDDSCLEGDLNKLEELIFQPKAVDSSN